MYRLLSIWSGCICISLRVDDLHFGEVWGTCWPLALWRSSPQAYHAHLSSVGWLNGYVYNSRVYLPKCSECCLSTRLPTSGILEATPLYANSSKETAHLHLRSSYATGKDDSMQYVIVGPHLCGMNKSITYGSCCNHLDIPELSTIGKLQGNRRWCMKIPIEAEIQNANTSRKLST